MGPMEQHPDDTQPDTLHDTLHDTGSDSPLTGTTRVKRGMAEMLKGGVIMDVVTAEQAKIAGTPGRSP